MPDVRQRIHPKLRVIMNGDDGVNAARAECTGYLKVPHDLAARAPQLAYAGSAEQLKTTAEIHDLTAPSARAEVNVFIEARNGGTKGGPGISTGGVHLSRKRIKVSEIAEMAAKPNVEFVAPAGPLKYPRAAKAALK